MLICWYVVQTSVIWILICWSVSIIYALFIHWYNQLIRLFVDLLFDLLILFLSVDLIRIRTPYFDLLIYFFICQCEPILSCFYICPCIKLCLCAWLHVCVCLSALVLISGKYISSQLHRFQVLQHHRGDTITFLFTLFSIWEISSELLIFIR